MLAIIKALLKDPAGISEEVKYNCHDWLVQEIYNQGDSRFRVSYGYMEELEDVSRQMESLTKNHYTNRWITSGETK